MPRLVAREASPCRPPRSIVHCTDTPGEWLVRVADGTYVMTREHAKGDAALRGPAAALLMRLWGRPTEPFGTVDVVGDPAAADAWLRLGGN